MILQISTLIILSFSIQLIKADWVLTHFEGYNQQFTQHSKDNGFLFNCPAYQIDIYASRNYLKKVISLNGFSSFGSSKILIEYIVPINSHEQITIQNFKVDISTTRQSFNILNDCFHNNNDYILKTFTYELRGGNYKEISIEITIDSQITGQDFIGIKQIHLFQLLCDEYCDSCSITDTNNQQTVCHQCKQGYTQQENKKCVCQQFIYGQQCLENCPLGYLPDYRTVCTEAMLLKSQELITVTQHLEENEYFEKTINLNVSPQVQLQLEIEEVNLEILQSYQIEINDQYYGIAAFYYDPLYISIFKIKEQICQKESKCQVVTLITPIINLNSNILSLKISLKHTSESFPQRFINSYYQSDLNHCININTIILNQINTIQTCMTKNCYKCDQNLPESCFLCSEGYLLYKEKCVKQCPFIAKQNGQICEDFLNNEYSYAIQGIGINTYNWAGELSFKDSYNYSQLYYRMNYSDIMFGGQWRNQEFTKILILEPHYSLDFLFTIIFVDFDLRLPETGFYYQIDGGNPIIIKPQQQQQFDGDSKLPDSKVNFKFNLLHKQDDIMITIGCITQGYCYIQDYVVIVNKCHPYCSQCQGSQKSDCQSFQKNVKEFDAKTQQCKIGYFETNQHICQKCFLNCEECFSNYECTKCKKGCTIKKSGEICDCE